ncbi:uncharacterized protein BX663DRAFT_486879 [Cokeromyces recurvatus]|uniref:uncharacterized protein n=1 Tax=Cokeromyces recurvatus TaxID=90255 RepID=UPI00221E3FE5|nr:uncharacterized protein BX663DRAFT_486879 [Cokeromyces recurvatus]KAI7902069.1 hypothetical protein BX663DRAFT_486879 [Cokeromyces recurvatus]
MKRFTIHDSNLSCKHLPVALEIDKAPVYYIGPVSRENPMSEIRTNLMGKVIFLDRKIKWNRVTLQFLVPIYQVEKELIFSGEEFTEFGLHLPFHLPPTCTARHSFLELSSKKYRTQKVVTVKRHYLPNPSVIIPITHYSGIKEWFEWYCTKQQVHILSPIITKFSPAIYHLPSFSNHSETHFIRTPIPSSKNPSIHTHQFDPFLEISHRLQLTVDFIQSSINLIFEFPIIITTFPSVVVENISINSSNMMNVAVEEPVINHTVLMIGDDAINIDLDLPEYTPRYEETSIINIR